MRPLSLTLAALTLLLATAAFAQGTSFTARLGRNPVGVGETFPFEVTLSGDSVQPEDYRRPEFRGLRVVAEQPSQSTQFQLGGGGSLMRQIYTWRYQLVAMQKGKLTIGPAAVRTAGRDLKTEKVDVTVVEAGQAPQPRQQARRGAPGFPGFFFPGLEPEPEPEPEIAAPPPDPSRPAGKRNYLRVVPSKTRAFVGEQITVQWFLYLVERQNNYAPTKEPRTDGFWVEELEVPQGQHGLSLSEQVVDGRVYLTAPLMRKALFGLAPGKFTITPLEADISRVDFFGATVRSEHLKADPVALELVPLPLPAPAGFDPSAVGRFTLTAEVDRDHVQVGDAITLKLRLRGQGNLRKIALPTLSRLEGWKVYDPKVSVELNRGDEVGGSKTAEYLLLPERPGQTDIPTLALATFDTQKAAYETVKTAPLHITVTGEALATGPARTAAATTPTAPASENLLALDVRPLHARASLRRDLGAALYQSPALLGVVIAPPALLALVGLWGAARTRLGQETESKRRRRLRRSASRRLRTATAHLREGRTAPALGEIERVLRETIEGKIGQPMAGMSRDELRSALASATPALVDATVATLDTCDRARFAPGSITAEESNAIIQKTGEIIEGFEQDAQGGGTP
jgi:hypothetical protein